MLNINYTLVLAEFSNSYGDGNGRHGHVANIPHLLDLYSNRVPAPGRPPAPGRAKSLRDNCNTFYMRVSEQVFCHPYCVNRFTLVTYCTIRSQMIVFAKSFRIQIGVPEASENCTNLDTRVARAGRGKDYSTVPYYKKYV